MTYEKKHDRILKQSVKTHIPNNLRGCNGFDGDFETRAAIRGSGTTLKPGLNINAEDNLALAA